MMKSLDKNAISLSIKKLFFSKQSKIDFLEYMGALLDAGIPSLSALIAIQKNHQGKKYRVIVTDLLQGIQNGKRIIDCIGGWFPNEIVAIIDGYDRVGRTSEGFIDAAESLSASNTKKSAFYGELAYPIAVCIMAIILMIFLNKTLLKGLVFELAKVGHVELPQDMIIYSHTADFLEEHWWGLIVVITLFVFFIKIILRNWSGKFRSHIDKLPLFAFYADSQTIHFFRKLGLFMKHNINLQSSLKLMVEKNTPYLKYYINSMLDKILKGEHKISKILNVGLIHKDYIDYLDIMEIAQQPVRSVSKLAAVIETQHKKVLKRIASMLRVLLFMLGTAGILASYLTIFDAKNVLDSYQKHVK